MWGIQIRTYIRAIEEEWNKPQIDSIYISKNGIDFTSINIGEGDNFHFTVKAKNWFAMRSTGEYSLIGCTVAPGFDYADFELAPKNWKPTNFNINFS